MQLRSDHLLAALQASPAKDPLRPYLVGVYVEASRGKVRYVATDGKIMFCCQHADADVTKPVHFIVARSSLRGLRNEAVLQVERIDHEGRKLEGVFLGGKPGSFVWDLLEGRFPLYHEVVPETTSGVMAQYDASNLERLHRAFCHLAPARARYFHLAHNGTQAGVATCIGVAAMGLAMPIITDNGSPKTARMFRRPLVRRK